MSNTIQTAMVRQYSGNVTFLYQEHSKLKGQMLEKMVHGRYGYFDRIGPTAAVKKTVRHGATPQVNTQHSRRRGELADYEWADLIDPQDEMRILLNPTAAYTVNAGTAMGRAYDEEAIDAFIASAWTGEEGTSEVVYPTGNIIEDGGGGTGMTVAKLRAAKLALDNVPVPQEDRKCVMSPEAGIDLLVDPQVTSKDFHIVSALTSGRMDTAPYMGFQFITTTLLPVASNIRECYVWHVNAMGMLAGDSLKVKVSERNDLSHATQVYVAGSFKGIRILDEGVRTIDIDESV
jgi:hypothetical protein